MPRVLLRNHKVHYQQTGQGPDVVLIHGLSCNIAFWWFNVAEHLARSHRVTAVDLRGHGVSGMTNVGYRPVDLAADVAALLDHLEVTGAHVVGHSFGGAVSAALAAERPDLVAQLTLADAWIPSLQPMAPLQGAPEWAATRARAEARGIHIDAHLPLVMRGLYAELLDEIDYLDSDHDEHTVQHGAEHWEDASRTSKAGQALRGDWRGSRIGGFWSRGNVDAGGLRSAWAAATPRFLQGTPGFRRGVQMPQAPAALHPSQRPAFAQVEKMTPEAREARMQVLRSGLSMSGKPGQPSHAVRRWHELMHNTHARREFMDTSGIEAPTLRDIRCSVWLVYGARSAYRTTADALQNLLPRTQLQIIPRASHYFPLLRPQALLRALEDRMVVDVPQEMQTPRDVPSKHRLRLVAQREEASLPVTGLFSASPLLAALGSQRGTAKGTSGT